MAIPEPGWYTDPDNTDQLRWWNGASWTELTEQRRRDDRVMPVRPNLYPETVLVAVLPLKKASVPAPAVKPISVLAPRPTGYVGPDAEPRRGRHSRSMDRPRNSPADIGIVFSLVSIALNPFALVSMLGIVYSAFGLTEAQRLQAAGFRTTWRGRSVIGLTVGFLALLFVVYQMSG